MPTRQTTMLDIMREPSTCYAIPEYQRRFAWGERQCEELWLDIARAQRSGANHFAGTILYDEREGAGAEKLRYVVDGQQRLTAVWLLIAALADHLEEGGNQDGALSSGSLRRTYLESFSPDASCRKAREATALFSSKMQEANFIPTELWQGLERLYVIAISLDKVDDAHEIFESLNSKGSRLCVADMLRNYLLSGKARNEQRALYEKYWIPIESSFYPDPGTLRLDAMVKAWISIRVRGVRARTSEEMFGAFKLFTEDVWGKDTEPLLEELRSFAVIWAENYHYHGVKKYRSMDWATCGPQTMTYGYSATRPDNIVAMKKLKEKLDAVDWRW